MIIRFINILKENPLGSRYEKLFKKNLLIGLELSPIFAVKEIHPLLQGNMSKQGLINSFISGDFVIDLRLHDKITMARNHGTGFRVKEDKLINLFSNISEIELSIE